LLVIVLKQELRSGEHFATPKTYICTVPTDVLIALTIYKSHEADKRRDVYLTDV